MSIHQKGGRKALSPGERLAQRRREYNSLDSTKKDGRKLPGSMSGRK